MSIKTKLAVSALLLGSVSAAQATNYSVHGMFSEGLTGGNMTEFVGSFDWNESTMMVSNFSGTMNESMQGAWKTGGAYVDGTPVTPPLPYPNYMLDMASDGGANYNQTAVGGSASATVYRLAGDDVVFGTGGNGTQSLAVDNGGDASFNTENAYFKLVFNYDTGTGAITSTGLQSAFNGVGTDPMNFQSANLDGTDDSFSAGLGNYDPTLVNMMEYGDCTLGSMMMMNNCMAGEVTGGSMMAGKPWAVELTVSQVPVPAAAWLFGGALLSLFGANRRKNVLPA